jgi:CHAT domain-containing protein
MNQYDLHFLVSAAAHSSELLDRALSQVPSLVRKDFADGAADLVIQGQQSGDERLISAAAMAAGGVYARLGMASDAWKNWLIAAEVQFMTSSTTVEYKTVHEFLQQRVSTPNLTPDEDTLAFAFFLSSNTAFFASQAAESNSKRSWLLVALADFNNIPGENQPEHLKQNMASLAQALSMVAWRMTPDGTDLELSEGLNNLARKVDMSIPSDLTFDDGLEKTKHRTSALATLSYFHGDRNKAFERWESAVGAPKTQRDFLQWLYDTFPIYMAKAVDVTDPAVIRKGRSMRWFIRIELERYRGTFLSRLGRYWAANVIDQIAGQMLWDDVKSGRYFSDELFQALEQVSSRVLLDQMIGDLRPFKSDKSRRKAADAEKKLLYPKSKLSPFRNEDNLGYDETHLLSCVQLGHAEALLTTGHDFVKPFVKSLDDLEEIYAAENAGFLGNSAIASLSEIRAALAPDEIVIEYCVIKEPRHPAKELLICAVTRDSVTLAPVTMEHWPGWRQSGTSSYGLTGDHVFMSIDSSPLGEAVREFRSAIRRGDDDYVRSRSRSLYDLLIGPLLSEGISLDRYKHWIVIPSRVLNSLPLSVLVGPDNKFFIEHVSLSYCPSASVWLQTTKRDAIPASIFCGFANPVLPAHKWPRLPDAEVELKEIHSSLPTLKCHCKSGSKATVKAMRDCVPTAHILHFATHAVFPPTDALDLHNLLLTPTWHNDGRLTAEQVRTLDLKQCKLVTLSVCNGGLYRFGAGNEPLGLIPAFLIAGAQNVLGTLWPLEDSMGRLFMPKFYEGLYQFSPAEAIRQACLKFIGQGAPTRQWATFHLYGAGRQFRLGAI